MTRKLTRLAMSPVDGGFKLHFEDDKGELIEMHATREQMDIIADVLDQLLAPLEGGGDQPANRAVGRMT